MASVGNFRTYFPEFLFFPIGFGGEELFEGGLEEVFGVLECGFGIPFQLLYPLKLSIQIRHYLLLLFQRRIEKIQILDNFL